MYDDYEPDIDYGREDDDSDLYNYCPCCGCDFREEGHKPGCGKD